MKYDLYLIILIGLFHTLPYLQLSLLTGNLPTLNLNLPFPHLIISPLILIQTPNLIIPNRASFIEQRKIYKLAIFYAKSSYYTQVINDLASDNRRLFRLANTLLSPPKQALLPSITNISPLLSCLFSKTFSNNIDSIIIKIKNHTHIANYPSIIVTPPISVSYVFFRSPHISLISILLNASSSISPSDPFPLFIFKLYSDYLCPTICNIISYSINSGTVPSIFKQAIITSILKKPSLDPHFSIIAQFLSYL